MIKSVILEIWFSFIMIFYIYKCYIIIFYSHETEYTWIILRIKTVSLWIKYIIWLNSNIEVIADKVVRSFSLSLSVFLLSFLLFPSSLSLRYLIKKLANSLENQLRLRNPSGLYVSALPIATQLLPVTAQQTTKKLYNTNDTNEMLKESREGGRISLNNWERERALAINLDLRLRYIFKLHM